MNSSERPTTVREAWRGWIGPADYDAHMDQNGQAQAAAGMLREFVVGRVRRGGRVWIAGAGTGRLFELVPPASLTQYRLTLTDLNHDFLTVLAGRVASARQDALIVADDLERTSIAAPHDAAIVVLVLEHVDVRRALDALTAVRPASLLLIVQRNLEGQASALVPGQTPVGSVAVLQSVHPRLVDAAEVTAALAERGYRLVETVARDVRYGKRLIGLTFSHGPI